MDRYDDALKAIHEAVIANGKVRTSQDAATLIEAAAPFFPAALRNQCRIVALRDEQVLRGRNDLGAMCFYRLLKGDVSVQKEVLGETLTLQRVVPGDWLLEPRPGKPSEESFAIMESASVLLKVPTQAFGEYLERESGFARAWCAELGLQMARMQRRIERFGLRHATQRVIHYLITESSGDSGEVVLPFRKRAWAAHMGMAAETLSRALGDLHEAGWVEKLGDNRFRLVRVL